MSRQHGQSPRCASCGELGHQSVVLIDGSLSCSPSHMALQLVDATGCSCADAGRRFGVTGQAIINARARRRKRMTGG